jgi:hypothetical protein
MYKSFPSLMVKEYNSGQREKPIDRDSGGMIAVPTTVVREELLAKS